MHYLCTLHDVPEGESRGFEFGPKSVVAVMRDGQLYTYLNWCPHLGIELNFMPDEFLDMDRQFITCANHGALFEIETGMCLSGPCQGEPLAAIRHELRGDEVWVELRDPPV